MIFQKRTAKIVFFPYIHQKRIIVHKYYCLWEAVFSADQCQFPKQ